MGDEAEKLPSCCWVVSAAGAAELVIKLGRGQPEPRLGDEGLGGFRPQLEATGAAVAAVLSTAAGEGLWATAEGRSSTVGLGAGVSAAATAAGACVGVVGVAGAEVVSFVVLSALSELLVLVMSVLEALVSAVHGARKMTSAMASVLQAAAARRASCVWERGRLAGQCTQHRIRC